ncbi:regulator [Streptacidiphilus sp. P02-A3a]|uniref:ATP-binding protein n=1 Tax=Streptacidiphilus sp. P02-A3a TaxID=2704468 RepID=UPI0015FD1654|nr:regulator [Streptacidiphilus sp. P02-A3a]QMU69215.1 regulator [Streptacidiphilus sp. P02-A3a]
MTDRRTGNLPSATTELIGRADELADAAALLADARLVTVTGCGGVGKSRVALRAAALAEPGYADGAWLVDCSPVRDSALLGHAVAEALRLTDGTARDPADVLIDHLARRELLLVLDGCEQLAEACAELAARLLAAAPGLRVLATSRQPLNAPGEHLLPVTPLPADSPEADAVTLFTRRARAVVPGFRLTPGNEAVVTALCRQLDGIPLALELAAGRLRALSVEQITERLDDRFRLLTGGSRSIGARHQTLRTTIGWSHELCSPQERLLWARISVFAGSFDLDAAEYICSGRGLRHEEVLDVMSDLVAKSIVVREQPSSAGEAAGEPGGYRLLDTVREYGAHWLRASGEERTLRRLHRDWYVGLASWGEIEWFSPRQVPTSLRTHRAHANLRAALDFCLGEPGEEQLALHLAGTLWYYWVGCGHLGEGRHWLELALAIAPEPTETRAKALWVAGYVCTLQGDLLRARPVLEECRSQALATGDDRALAYAVHRQGCAALIGDELPRATELFQEALWHYEKLGELNSNVLMAMFELGLALLFQGEQAQGEAWMAKVRRQCEEHGEQWAYTYGLFAMAYAAWLNGDFETARNHARESLRLNHVFRDLVGTALAVEVLALLATEPVRGGGAGDLREARLLQGAAHVIWSGVGVPLFGSRSFNAAHAECELRVLSGLSEAEAAESFRRGTALGLEGAVCRALEGPGRTAPPAAVRLPGARR